MDDASKVKEKLGWKLKISIEILVQEMMRDKFVESLGYNASYHE